MVHPIFKHRETKIILGILWGLGLACIFRNACNGRNCIILKAPKPAEVTKNIYGHEEKCFKYEPITTECTGNEVV